MRDSVLTIRERIAVYKTAVKCASERKVFPMPPFYSCDDFPEAMLFGNKLEYGDPPFEQKVLIGLFCIEIAKDKLSA